jgi:hypothetical protein
MRRHSSRGVAALQLDLFLPGAYGCLKQEANASHASENEHLDPVVSTVLLDGHPPLLRILPSMAFHDRAQVRKAIAGVATMNLSPERLLGPGLDQSPLVPLQLFPGIAAISRLALRDRYTS